MRFGRATRSPLAPANGSRCQGSRSRTTAEQLTLRNPRWSAFVNECVSEICGALGIRASAVVRVSLASALLAERGALLPVNSRQRSRRGQRFGTLLVVLPSEFEGGDIVFPTTQHKKSHDDEDHTADATAMRRPTPYELTYAAFYDDCVVRAEPVTSGVALCLVYDLSTPTPSDVPLFAGPLVVQQLTNEALDAFFSLAPAHVTKRAKLSADAWRAIYEFAAVERHFVYAVQGKNFEDLRGDDAEIASCLARFCATSEGQYVLFHVGVLFSNEGEHACNVTLRSPWLKYKSSTAEAFPPVFIDEEIVTQRHRDLYNTAVYKAYALVVQPASIVQLQAAKMHLDDVVPRLRSLLSKSRDEAQLYARRAIACRPVWRLENDALDAFPAFLAIIIELNDCELFMNLLRCLTPHRRGALHLAIDHFGWDVCATAVLERIRSTATLRHRVLLVNAVVDRASDPARINQLLDALCSLHPWTDVKVGAYRKHRSNESYGPDADDFGRLLMLASPAKVIELTSVTDPETHIYTVIPALVRLQRNDHDNVLSAAVLDHVCRLSAEQVAVIRNRPFARIRLNSHCDACVQVEAFLKSTETQTTMRNLNPSQRKHVRDVLQNRTESPGMLTVEFVHGPALRFTKKLGFTWHGVHFDANRAEERLQALVAARGGQ